MGSWELCGERFYARHQLHVMAWGDINLQNMRCAAAWGIASLRLLMQCCLRPCSMRPELWPHSLLQQDLTRLLQPVGKVCQMLLAYRAAATSLSR